MSVWGYSWGYSWGDAWGLLADSSSSGWHQRKPTKRAVKRARVLYLKFKSVAPKAAKEVVQPHISDSFNVDFAALAADAMAIAQIREELKRVKRKRDEESLFALGMI